MNATLEAMARAYNLAKYADPITGPALVAVNEALIKPSGKDIRWMLAALRALAACEPSEGMEAAWGDAVGPVEDWRAMLAELVKECERDG